MKLPASLRLSTIFRCASRLNKRARLVALVESSNDAILAVGLDKTILSWNNGAERLYGYTAEEVLGKSAGMLVPEEFRSQHDAMFERMSQGESFLRFQSVRRRKDGSLIDVALTYSLIRDPQGKPLGASAVVQDITERKRSEERRVGKECRSRWSP